MERRSEDGMDCCEEDSGGLVIARRAAEVWRRREAMSLSIWESCWIRSAVVKGVWMSTGVGDER